MLRPLLVAILLSASAAYAQDSMSSMSNMGSKHHMANASMHTMPATVSSVDKATGFVEVASAGTTLKVHFPPAALGDLKAGDKITLHLGFTKP